MKWNMYVRTVCAYIEKSRRMECCVLMPSITNESNAMLILPKVSGSQNLKILKISRCLGTLGFSLNWAGKSSKHGHPGSRCSRANEMLRYWSRAQQPKPIEWYPFLMDFRGTSEHGWMVLVGGGGWIGSTENYPSPPLLIIMILSAGYLLGINVPKLTKLMAWQYTP